MAVGQKDGTDQPGSRPERFNSSTMAAPISVGIDEDGSVGRPHDPAGIPPTRLHTDDARRRLDPRSVRRLLIATSVRMPRTGRRRMHPSAIRIFFIMVGQRLRSRQVEQALVSHVVADRPVSAGVRQKSSCRLQQLMG